MAPLPPPSPEVRKRFSLAASYTQCTLVGPVPIVGSSKVRPQALLEGAWLIQSAFGSRTDILTRLAIASVRVAVMAVEERTTDVPEHADLEPASYWNRRARGLGATAARPAVSGAEENLLGIPGDPYDGECILIHEFAHAVATMALPELDPSFPKRLAKCHRDALESGFWKGTYAITNPDEYWAEGIQCWFHCNQPRRDKSHNGVWDRSGLQRHDPRLHRLIAEILPRANWTWSHPSRRAGRDHLEGWDPRSATRFAW